MTNTNYEEVLRIYYEHFDELNYSGCTGAGTRAIWRKMETVHRNSHFGKVLELGATNLQHLAFVRHSFDEYIASDIFMPRKPMSEIMQKKIDFHKKIQFEIQDATDISHKDNTFDRTLTTCLFHHLAKPELAMQEMLRVTKPGGIISFSLPGDPGALLRIMRAFTSRHRANKKFERNELPNPKLIWALEHRNHIAGLRILLNDVFKNLELKRRGFPYSSRSWNFTLWEFYDIKKD